MRHTNKDQKITPELIEKLKRKAMMMEDEIAIEGGRRFEETGRLNDPALCEKGIEYENLRLDIATLEGMLAKMDEQEKRDAGGEAAPGSTGE